MDFKTNKPIYQQIVDFCFSKILTREWTAGERVVSVRELSTQLAVNSRTVLKAYEYLQAEDIIYPERGMGFYLSKDAMKKVMKIQKKEFFENQLADLFNIMDLLGISIDEIINLKTAVHEEIRKDSIMDYFRTPLRTHHSQSFYSDVRTEFRRTSLTFAASTKKV